MNNDKILTELVLSVMAIQGKLKNLFLNEYLVDFYRPKGNVLCIESNCGKNVHPDYNYIKTKNKKERKSKHINKRREQCKGPQFNSMVQFHVKSFINSSKVYKIKIFRQETFNIPGILKHDMSDVMPALNELCEYHKEVNLQGDNDENTIYIDDIFPILINFKCKIVNDNLSIELKKIVNQLNLYKDNPNERDQIMDILKKSGKFSTNMLITVNKYIPINRLNMAEIKYAPERFPSGITVKFYRPSIRINKPKDLNAKSTIKIFKSGKINFDAFKRIEEANDLYIWFNYFINKYYKYIIYDYTKSSDESYDSSSNDSETESS